MARTVLDSLSLTHEMPATLTRAVLQDIIRHRDAFWVSPKSDGLRVIVILAEDGCFFYGRNGKLDDRGRLVRALPVLPLVFDAELLSDKRTLEPFQLYLPMDKGALYGERLSCLRRWLVDGPLTADLAIAHKPIVPLSAPLLPQPSEEGYVFTHASGSAVKWKRPERLTLEFATVPGSTDLQLRDGGGLLTLGHTQKVEHHSQARIVECAYQGGFWTIVGHRDDRKDPNSIGVAFTTMCAIADNITRGELHVKLGLPPGRSGKKGTALIIPYRDRMAHLEEIVAHFRRFWPRIHPGRPLTMYVMHQMGTEKFNRGTLLNAGFIEAVKDDECSQFIMHDVDLLPNEEIIRDFYAVDHTGALQIGHLESRYTEKEDPKREQSFFGAITSFNEPAYRAVNGFSNAYWGWGSEDDDLRQRCRLADVPVHVPSKDPRYRIRDLEGMTIKEKKAQLKATGAECMNRWECRAETDRVWYHDGLMSCPARVAQVLFAEGDAEYVTVKMYETHVGAPVSAVDNE